VATRVATTAIAPDGVEAVRTSVPPKLGQWTYDGIDHVRHAHVEAEDRAAVDLERECRAGQGLADALELRIGDERGARGRRQQRRGRRHLPVGEGHAARNVTDHAIADRVVARRGIADACHGGAQQQGPRHGAGIGAASIVASGDAAADGV
jgi:hypothetical protein